MPRRFFAIWGWVFVGCFILATLAYATAPSAGSTAVSYVLWPGVVLYAALNGSLLFGAGFGTVGNFLFIAAGSALAWSLVFGLLVLAWLRASKLQRYFGSP